MAGRFMSSFSNSLLVVDTGKPTCQMPSVKRLLLTVAEEAEVKTLCLNRLVTVYCRC